MTKRANLVRLDASTAEIEDPDFSAVTITVGSNVYLRQGGDDIVMSRSGGQAVADALNALLAKYSGVPALSKARGEQP